MPITNAAWVRALFCKLQKGCTRLTAASDRVYHVLAQGRWFSPASSTNKTGSHDIAESGVKHNKSINQPITSTTKTNKTERRHLFLALWTDS
jgi:hypothetical protein